MLNSITWGVLGEKTVACFFVALAMLLMLIALFEKDK
jgi:hypothetical protein